MPFQLFGRVLELIEAGSLSLLVVVGLEGGTEVVPTVKLMVEAPVLFITSISTQVIPDTSKSAVVLPVESEPSIETDLLMIGGYGGV